MCDVRKVLRYQRGNHKLQIEEVQTIQWPKEKGTKGKTIIYKTLHRKQEIEQQDPH